MPWTKILDDLKQRAAANIQPIPSDLDTFGLDKLREWVKQASACVVGGWEFLLSRAEYEDKVIHWHLSALLYPKGRGSSEEDWRFVGQVAAYLGAPKEPMIVPEDPNRTIHWHWTEN